MKADARWTGSWQAWFGRRLSARERQAQAEEQDLRRDLEVARRELEAAELYFQAATDPELVDHAIFAVEAARRKYLYLYRRLRSLRSAVLAAQREQAEWI
jgi:hypothetical protein